MWAWVQRQLRAFEATYDVSAAMAASAPAGAAFAAGSLALTLGVIGYLPSLRHHSGFEGAWVGMVIAVIAGLTSYTAWRHGCRGPVGSAATLCDNALYASALFYAACRVTAYGYGIAFAGIEIVILCAIPAQVYGLSPQLFVVTAIPGALALAFGNPHELVALVIVIGYVVYWAVAYVTWMRRRYERQQLRLRAAVAASRQVADESMQTALGSTLLGLGHFLHELKNHQTAVRANLSFIGQAANLDDETREALADALASQDAQQALIRETIQQLQAKAKREEGEYTLAALLGSISTDVSGVAVHAAPEQGRVLLRGDLAHMGVVLTNLIRNAAQAGARNVWVEGRLDASGRGVRIVVQDDGPGVPRDRWDSLFEPFGSSTKPDGTGLGLYLCRRYVELGGGTITIDQGDRGGASFVVVVPGRLDSRTND